MAKKAPTLRTADPISTVGLDTFQKKLAAYRSFPHLVLRTGAKATTGRLFRVRSGGWITDTRTAGQNVIAVRSNAKKGRNIARLSRAEKRDTVSPLRKSAREWALSGDNAYEPLIAAMHVMVKKLFAVWRKHGKSGRGAEGPFRPVLDSTQRQKDRETKIKGLPPMFRTGQVLRSFIYEILKR